MGKFFKHSFSMFLLLAASRVAFSKEAEPKETILRAQDPHTSAPLPQRQESKDAGVAHNTAPAVECLNYMEALNKISGQSRSQTMRPDQGTFGENEGYVFEGRSGKSFFFKRQDGKMIALDPEEAVRVIGPKFADQYRKLVKTVAAIKADPSIGERNSDLQQPVYGLKKYLPKLLEYCSESILDKFIPGEKAKGWFKLEDTHFKVFVDQVK